MGLMQNGFRHNTTGKLFGGTSLNGANPSVHEYSGHLTARMRNQFSGERITDDLASVPNGARHPAAWVMARANGGMASRNAAVLAFAPAGAAVGGVTSSGEATLTLTPAASAWPLDDSVQIRTASASITFTVADAAGQLISGGSGSASMAFSTNTPLLTASLAAVGSTSFALSASGALGAEASGEGAASMAFSMAATILPTVDTPPARTATASLAVTGTLTPYAIGHMGGSTLNTQVLTTDTIAAAVWQALAASFADAGTMGQKLNNAASGGVDYADLANAVWSHTQ